VADHPWSGPEGWASALALVDGFVEAWEAHRSVLRLIDLATDEGDHRFRDVRTRLLGAPAEALVAVLKAQRGSGGIDPYAQAGVGRAVLARRRGAGRGVAVGVVPAGPVGHGPGAEQQPQARRHHGGDPEHHGRQCSRGGDHGVGGHRNNASCGG
jgi:hypothetical protein